MIRRTILCLVVFTVPLAGLAGPASYFIRTLGGPDNDRVQASAEMNGLLYFAGLKDNTGLFSRGLLLATTPEGEVVFERTYEDSTGLPVEFTALAARDGVLHLAGTVGTFPDTGTAFVASLAPNGDILEQSAFLLTREAFARELIPTADGGLLLAGTVVVPGDTIGDGWIVKLGADGAIEWQRQIGTGGSDGLNAAKQLPEGGYVLAGGLGSEKDPFGTLQGWLLELDPSGNVVWQRGYVSAVGDSFHEVLVDRDIITAVGVTCDFCFFRGDGWIVSTGPTGLVESTWFVGDFSFQGFDDIIDAAPAEKGQGFFVLGSTDTIPGPMQQMWAAKIDNRGAVRWIRQIGGEGFEMAGTMTVLPDGDLAFGGYSVTNLNQDVYVGKLGRNGRRPGACDTVADTNPAAYRTGSTRGFPSDARVADTDAVAVAGGLVAGTTPSTVNDPICFE